MMALLEATGTLLDLPFLHDSPLPSSPPSPSFSAFSRLSPAAPWANTSSDDESSSVTSQIPDQLFSLQPCESPPGGADVSLTSSSTCSSLQDDDGMEFSLHEFQTGLEVEVLLPSSEDEQPVCTASTNQPAAKTKERQKTGEGKRRVPRPTSANNRLPPCRICADAASGFHYGVNSCEACKRFFRRALKRKRHFKCRGSKNCAIKGKKSGLCGYCRYSRCLALGMSRTAIKTGRYTHEKRAQDILEVQRRVSHQTSLSTTDSELHDLLQALMATHSKVITNADVADEVMLARARQKREEFELKKEMFGFQDTLTAAQYDEVFRVTGLDVDERQKHMRFVAKALDTFVYGYVCFGKGVPGFADLPLSDQANLLKLARVEVWFLGAYRGYISDYDIFFAPNRDCRHRFELERLMGREYTECAFQLAASLRKLRLSQEEEVLLKAVCLTFGDRCPLQAPRQVEAVQWRLLRCFLHLARRRRPDDPRFFPRVMSWATAVRNLTELSRKGLANSHFSNAIRSHATLFDMILV